MMIGQENGGIGRSLVIDILNSRFMRLNYVALVLHVS